MNHYLGDLAKAKGYQYNISHSIAYGLIDNEQCCKVKVKFQRRSEIEAENDRSASNWHITWQNQNVAST